MKARRTQPRRSGNSQQLEERALRRLAWLMENAGSEQAQVSAAKELLDRMCGPAGAAHAQEDCEGLEQVVARLRELRHKGDEK